MAQPPAADSPPPPPLDRDVWLACATPLSRLPAVGSQVYYFPHGHSEQCPAPLPAPLPVPHLFPCTVAAVDLFADAKTDEPYATISLVPGPHRGPSPDDAPVPSPTDAQAQVLEDRPFCYYAKLLTQSDANNGGGFSVPRFCADSIFPKLDFNADPPVQKLRMRDLLGKQWDFRHIYRGTTRRHLLTTGWRNFINAKLLVAGYAAVFMRRPDGRCACSSWMLRSSAPSGLTASSGPSVPPSGACSSGSTMWLSLGRSQEKVPDDSHKYNTHVLTGECGKRRSSYRIIYLQKAK